MLWVELDGTRHIQTISGRSGESIAVTVGDERPHSFRPLWILLLFHCRTTGAARYCAGRCRTVDVDARARGGEAAMARVADHARPRGAAIRSTCSARRIRRSQRADCCGKAPRLLIWGRGALHRGCPQWAGLDAAAHVMRDRLGGSAVIAPVPRAVAGLSKKSHADTACQLVISTQLPV